MVVVRYSNQQGSKPRQNPCQVQPTEKIGSLSASRPCLWVRTRVSTFGSAVSISEWIYTCNPFFFFFLFNITYSRRTSSLPSCLWSLRIFPSLPGSRLTIFYRDASSALLQLVNQWLNFTYSRQSHAFRYERKNTNPTLVRIELTTSAHAGVQVTY